jgi:spore coat-associated protein N
MPPAHRRRLLAGLLALLLLLLLSSAAIAAWVATRTNPGNSFQTGRLALGDSVTGPILSGDNLAPGDAVSGTVTISNSGTVPVTVTLSARNPSHASGAGAATLATVLQVSVTDCAPSCAAGTTVYSGTLDALGTVDVPGTGAKGRWRVGEAHRYLFVATLPQGVDNAVQGAAASVDFLWTAGSG